MKKITITPYYMCYDVLIKPKFSNIKSRKMLNSKSKLTENIIENANYIFQYGYYYRDKMAIEIASLGGLGIIHRYCTIQQQVDMVKKVKRHTNYLITNPYTVNNYEHMDLVKNNIEYNKVDSLLVINNNDELVGIFTKRDDTI